MDKKSNIMLSNIRNTISNRLSSNIWLQKSWKDKNDEWRNDDATIQEIVKCKDDSIFYNIWMNLKEGSEKELDTLIEEQLIPNQLGILTDTEKVSSSGTSVRFMIARPLNN